MKTTLKDRVRECMLNSQLTNAQLAAACNVKPPTAFNWASGKTLNIKGEPLLLAAKVFNVRPEWLATGVGPKTLSAGLVVENSSVAWSSKKNHDQWTEIAIGIFTALQPHQREGAVAALRTHVSNLGKGKPEQLQNIVGN